MIVFALLSWLFLTRLNGPNVEAVQRLAGGVLEVIQAQTLAIVKPAPVGILALPLGATINIDGTAVVNRFEGP